MENGKLQRRKLMHKNGPQRRIISSKNNLLLVKRTIRFFDSKIDIPCGARKWKCNVLLRLKLLKIYLC